MNTFATLGAVFAVLIIAGCTSTTPYWDAHFGAAARSVTAQQVINPDASLNQDSAEGMDGKAAAGAIEEYRKSYTNPQPQPQALTIGVGSGSGR